MCFVGSVLFFGIVKEQLWCRSSNLAVLIIITYSCWNRNCKERGLFRSTAIQREIHQHYISDTSWRWPHEFEMQFAHKICRF